MKMHEQTKYFHGPQRTSIRSNVYRTIARRVHENTIFRVRNSMIHSRHISTTLNMIKDELFNENSVS